MSLSPETLLHKAERALASARLLLGAQDAEGASNRAYYAMYDAARAALAMLPDSASVDEPKTHSGLIGAFGLRLVKTGRMPTELGSAFNRTERLRRLADYTGEPVTMDEASWAVQQASSMVAAVKSLPIEPPG